jgi:uncharacterized phage-associated protein
MVPSIDKRMLMPSAHDVARELRSLIPAAGRVKVQKLLYYCHGWHLAFTGNPMFSERVEAWELGPVVPAVYSADKYAGFVPPSQELDDATARTIHWVVGRYGSLTASDLVTLTHAEDPWKDAYAKTTANRVVSNEALLDWFGRFVAKPIANHDDGALTGVDEMPELLRLLSELVS